MKLEELGRALEAMHKTRQSALSIMSGGHHYIYLCDPVSGDVERRCMGECQHVDHAGHVGVARIGEHGLGAVCD